MHEAEDEPLFAERAAGIDIAKAGIEVTVRVPSDTRRGGRQQETRPFRTTRKDLLALADWLRCWQVTKVGMESTDYWRIWHYLAEAAGLEVWLVNARDVKHLPGRGKSDRLDCVWHCKLNERGIPRRSFVPPQPVRDLRALTRTRSRLAQDQAGPEPGREVPRRRAAEDLGGDLRPVRRQRAAVPGRPGRRGAQPQGAGRARRHAARGHPAGAGSRAHRPVP